MRIGLSANTYLQHQDAFQADFLARARSSQARITTRDIGFSIGGFGLRWQSRDVEFDASEEEARAAERKETEQARIFREEMDVATVRDRLADLATVQPTEMTPLASAQAGASTFSHALSAYTRTAGLAEYEPLPGKVLGVA